LKKQKGQNSKSSVKCSNCKCKGHAIAGCWRPGGGKEGQGPLQKSKSKKTDADTKATANSATTKTIALTAFTPDSLHAYLSEDAIAAKASVLQSKIYDSGATCHMSPYKDEFVLYTQLKHPINIGVADGREMNALGYGDISVKVPYEGKYTLLSLKDVLHIPEMAFTLVSLS
jgi:hypothetical protein